MLLSTDNLVLRNAVCKKFKQRYIGPYLITHKISDQAYQLELPDELQCHPVFHISKLKRYFPCENDSAVLQRIPAFFEEPPEPQTPVIAILEHAVRAFPERYRNGPALVFKIQLDGHPPTECWKPYVEVKQLDVFSDYCSTNTHLHRLLRSSPYQDLHRRYPSRFPSVLP